MQDCCWFTSPTMRLNSVHVTPLPLSLLSLDPTSCSSRLNRDDFSDSPSATTCASFQSPPRLSLSFRWRRPAACLRFEWLWKTRPLSVVFFMWENRSRLSTEITPPRPRCQASSDPGVRRLTRGGERGGLCRRASTLASLPGLPSARS